MSCVGPAAPAITAAVMLHSHERCACDRIAALIDQLRDPAGGQATRLTGDTDACHRLHFHDACVDDAAYDRYHRVHCAIQYFFGQPRRIGPPQVLEIEWPLHWLVE